MREIAKEEGGVGGTTNPSGREEYLLDKKRSPVIVKTDT